MNHEDLEVEWDAMLIKPSDGKVAYLIAQAVMELRALSHDVDLIAKKLGAIEDEPGR